MADFYSCESSLSGFNRPTGESLIMTSKLETSRNQNQLQDKNHIISRPFFQRVVRGELWDRKL